ncbi:MAG: histidine phosphatase family protein, partial [Vallitaleaceae bacterium]|nr:histidine phosphatase family protein [Vallitaleaceae bacterium]
KVMDRAGDFFDRVIKSSTHKNILIVSHGILLKGLFTYLQKQTVEQFWSGAHLQPTCLSKAVVKADTTVFEYIGDTSHYKEKTTGNGWFIDEK